MDTANTADTGQAMQALRTSLTGPSASEAAFTLAAARIEIWRLRARLKSHLGQLAFSGAEDDAWERLHTRIVEAIDWLVTDINRVCLDDTGRGE